MVTRPDPETLLKRVQAETQRAGRAQLKVYLGYAPGVGKTFKMLSQARELVFQGTDVVIGVIEHHGRAETASLVLGLDVVPQRQVDYRGVKLMELDLDAVLRRKPRVVLVDEFAHTNAPGSRHASRWQDVMELLDAGIEVHTTLNIQHLESLNDVVEQVTGVRVRETVPDAALDRADHIEMVDLPPEELMLRLKEGKVYMPDQAARAATNFFKRGNLLALRELALRRVAERVDADVLAWRDEHAVNAPWATAERILVCVGAAPASARLIRAARRMAAGLRTPWVAVSVEALGGPDVSAADRAQIDDHLRLAESLGAEVARLSGPSVATAILDYARAHNVTRLILGKPTHSRVRDLVRRPLVDEIVRGSGGIDVLIISGDDVRPAPRPDVAAPPLALQPFAWAFAAVCAATVLAWGARTLLALPDLVMLYLGTIMFIAVRFGRAPAVVAALLSTAAYDFFFVPPFFTFAVSDTRHVLTFVMMFGTGLITSSLMARIRRQESQARDREARTAVLYALTRELAAAVDLPAIAAETTRLAAQVFGVPATTWLQSLEPVGAPLSEQERAVATWARDHRQPAGLGTDTLPGTQALALPIAATQQTVGALVLRLPHAPDLEQRHFLEVFCRQVAQAVERVRLAEDARAAALHARTEELRSSLLSAVSHDLRTPLAAITGAATTLRDNPGVPAPERHELENAIVGEAERLERLVGNLLHMTRLESGVMTLKREWVPVEELVGSALTRLEGPLQGREVSTRLDAQLPLLQVDPLLIEQVLVNLLENALKYTPEGSPIELSARREGDQVLLTVGDRGPGLPVGSETQIFEKFFRGPTQVKGGAGLGLAIVRGMVEAHQGSVSAANREGGGAVFTIRLPCDARPPSVESPEAP